MPLLLFSLGTLLFALAVAATPLTQALHGSPTALLNMRRGPWQSHGAHTFLQRDKTRARNLITRDSSTSMTESANTPQTFNAPTNDTGVIHCVPVGIGIPPKTCTCDP